MNGRINFRDARWGASSVIKFQNAKAEIYEKILEYNRHFLLF